MYRFFFGSVGILIFSTSTMTESRPAGGTAAKLRAPKRSQASTSKRTPGRFIQSADARNGAAVASGATVKAEDTNARSLLGRRVMSMPRLDGLIVSLAKYCLSPKAKEIPVAFIGIGVLIWLEHVRPWREHENAGSPVHLVPENPFICIRAQLQPQGFTNGEGGNPFYENIRLHTIVCLSLRRG